MPLDLIPHQPFFKDDLRPTSWECEEDYYCHRLAPSDVMYMQFRQSTCGVNLVADDNFNNYTLGAEVLSENDFTTVVNWVYIAISWTHAAGKLTHVLGNTDSVGQSIVGQPSGWYEVKITLADTTQGGVTVATAGTLSGVSPFLTDNGETTLILWYDSGGSQILISPSSDFDGALDSIYMKPVTYTSWTIPNGFNPQVEGICKFDTTSALTIDENVGNYLITGTYYRVDVSISQYADGTLTVDCSDITSAALSGNGIKTFYATPGADGVLHIDFDADFVGCIDYIRVYEMRNDYTFVVAHDSTSKFNMDSQYIHYFEDYVTVIYDPADDALPFGCMTIAVRDECDFQSGEYIINGEFTGGSGTLCPNWVNNNAASQYDYTGNQCKLSYDGALFANSKIWTAFNDVQPYYTDNVGQITNYRITFDVIAVNTYAGDGVTNKAVPDINDVGVTVQIEGQTTAATLFNTVGVNKTYIVALPANHPLNDTFATNRAKVNGYAARLGDPLGTKCDITVDNIRIAKLAPYEQTYTTECIKYDSHARTSLIQGICDTNNLGFEFENTGFRLSQRIACKAIQPDYEIDGEQYSFSSGNREKYYGQRAKFFTLFIELAAESVHDTFSVQILCDTFSIGDSVTLLENFVTEDQYTPEYERTNASLLAQGRIRLTREIESTVYKRRC